MVFHTTDKQVFSTFGKTSGKNSEPETWYFGSPTSDHQVRAYDKKREILSALAHRLDKHTRLKISDLIKASESIEPCMRVEASLKNMDLHPSELHTLKNPFDSTLIYSLPRLSESSKTDFDRLFIDSVRYQGLSMALARIRDQPTYRRLVRMVNKYRVDWWNPEKLGSQLKDAILHLGILPEAAFDQKTEMAAMQKKEMRIGSLSTMRNLPINPIRSRR